VARQSRDRQQQRVVDAAAELFAERGTDDVTMAEIAEHAGVARASVFNYFGSKHALVEAITESVLDFWVAMLDTALEDEATPTPMLIRRLCDEMAKGIESQRLLHRGVFREIARIQLGLDSGDVAQLAGFAASTRLIRLMERGQSRGELDDSLSAEALASAFHSLTNGTITNWLYQDPTRPLSVRLQESAEVFLRPIALPRPSRSQKRGSRT
jgi:AcrR family transcriptional regulator